MGLVSSLPFCFEIWSLPTSAIWSKLKAAVVFPDRSPPIYMQRGNHLAFLSCSFGFHALLYNEGVWEDGGGCIIQALLESFLFRSPGHFSRYMFLTHRVRQLQMLTRADESWLCTQLYLFCKSYFQLSYSALQSVSHNEDLSWCLLPHSHLLLIKMSSQPT